MDLMGFDKDRTHWYRAWFPTVNSFPGSLPAPVELHAFPHWNWPPGTPVDIWSFSAADSVELIVNGASLGKQKMPKYSHVQWLKVPFVAGSYTTIAYDASGAVVASKVVNTTGAPAALRASIRDGFGASMLAGCNDFGLVMVEVLDANGLLVPDTSDVVTLSISGTATSWIEGSGNGDPAGDYNNKLPMHQAYHGLMLGVIGAGNDVGTITVTATAPGLAPSSVQLKVVDGSTANSKWCNAAIPKW